MVGCMTSPLMTSQQVADAMKVHRSTVHRWVTKGLLTPAQVVDVPGESAMKLYLFDPQLVSELASRQPRLT